MVPETSGDVHLFCSNSSYRLDRYFPEVKSVLADFFRVAFAARWAEAGAELFGTEICCLRACFLLARQYGANHTCTVVGVLPTRAVNPSQRRNIARMRSAASFGRVVLALSRSSIRSWAVGPRAEQHGSSFVLSGQIIRGSGESPCIRAAQKWNRKKS